MLLPEEVAYGVVPVEGRAATGVLHQDTLHSVDRDGEKDSEEARAWVGDVCSHEQDARESGLESRLAATSQHPRVTNSTAKLHVTLCARNASHSDEHSSDSLTATRVHQPNCPTTMAHGLKYSRSATAFSLPALPFP